MAELKADGTSPTGKESPETGENLEETQTEQLGDMLADFIAPVSEESASDPTQDGPGVRPDLNKQKKEEEDATSEEGSNQEIEEVVSQEGEQSRQAVEGQDDETEEGGEETGEVSPELASLRAELEILKAEKQAIVDNEAASKAKADAAQAIADVDLSDILSEEEIAEFESNPRKIFALLAKRTYARAREDTIKDIPKLVEGSHARQMAIHDARMDFQKNFPDLSELTRNDPVVQNLVRITANKLQSDNPNMSMDQIFSATGKQVTTTLGLAKKAQEKEKSIKTSNQPSKPRGQRRGKQAKDERSDQQKEIASLLDL